MLKAVLWDMGGPIDEEVGYERLIDEDMKRALTEAGVRFRKPTSARPPRWAVDSFDSPETSPRCLIPAINSGSRARSPASIAA